jgi:hypothetical protein
MNNYRLGMFLLFVVMVGCDGDIAPGNPRFITGSTAGAGGQLLDTGTVIITDDTNYTFSSTITPQSTVVKDATDLTFDWSALTQDFYGRPIDPTRDIDLVLVSLWGMTEVELVSAINDDRLQPNNNKGIFSVYPTEGGTPGPTSTRLLEMNSFRNEVSEDEVRSRFDTSTPGYQYPQSTHTFMLMAQKGTDPGRGVQMLGLFHLDPASANTTVALTNASTTLTYSAHLAQSPQIEVPVGMAELIIDWSNMTTNALGRPFDASKITEVVVANYPTYTISQIEQRFIYMKEEAGAWYSGEVLAEATMDLSSLTDGAGVPFRGINATGVWLVALFCTSCHNPAPWSIIVLKPGAKNTDEEIEVALCGSDEDCPAANYCLDGLCKRICRDNCNLGAFVASCSAGERCVSQDQIQPGASSCLSWCVL